MIINPNPTTPATFDKMWVSYFRVQLVTPVNPRGTLMVMLLPYNGTDALTTNRKQIFFADLGKKMAENPTVSNLITSVVTEIERQTSHSGITTLLVCGADPTQAVFARAEFEDGTFFVIPNCFELAASDATFAGVFMNAMAEIAHLADLPVT